MIKRYEKFILEFLETSDSIDAKMNELSDLISNSSEGNDIMYKWENKKDEELVVNFLFNGDSIRYELDIKNLELTKVINEEIYFQNKVSDTDEAMDIIEKDIHLVVGISEKKNIKLFEEFQKVGKFMDDFEISNDEDDNFGEDDFEDFGDGDNFDDDFEEDRENLEGGELDDDDQETLEELEELLAVEFENKVRETGDESKLTIDPFLLEYGIEPEYVTGFGWASIMNKREKYKDMPDEEFKEIYVEKTKDLI